MSWMNRVLMDEADPDGGKSGGDPPVEKAPPEADPPAPPSIPLSVIPEHMRGMSEPELQFTLSRMITAASGESERIQALEAQVASLSAPPPPPDPLEDKTFGEYLDEDPEAAIDNLLQRRGYKKPGEEPNTVLDSLVISTFKNSNPDFVEHEDDVKAVLAQGGVAITPENIQAAYTYVLGKGVLDERAKNDRALHSPEGPSHDPPKKVTEHADLIGTEAEMFAASGMDRDSWESGKDINNFDIKTPS